MRTSDKKIHGNPLSVIEFESVDNVVNMKWHSLYITFLVAQGQKIYLLDDEGKKYTFYCIAADNNHGTTIRYIGDFNSIEDKKIVQYRIETINGVMDYSIDKSKIDTISKHYKFIKSEIEKYFPTGVLDIKDTMDILNQKVEMKDIIDALNKLSKK